MTIGRTRPGFGTEMAAVLVAMAAAMYVQSRLGLTSDVSWLLTVNERIIAGERLYLDLHETNPAFSIWLYRLPVLIGLTTPVSAETALYALIAIGLAASVGFSVHLLRLAAIIGTDRHTLTALAVAIILIFGVFAGTTFAQREFIGLVALLPWIALQVARAEMGSSWRPARWVLLLCGASCAAMVMVKPYWVLTVLMPVLLLAARQRSVRPFFHGENLLGAAVFVAYIGIFHLMHPYYFTTYADMLMAVYAPVRMPAIVAIHTLLATLMVTAIAIVRRPATWSSATWVCVAAAFGQLAGTWVMGRAFIYHVFPVYALLALALVDSARSAPILRLAPSAAIAGLAMSLAAAIFFWSDWPDPAIEEHLAEHHHGGTAIAISPSFNAGHPLVRDAGMHWVAPGPALLYTFYGGRSLQAISERDPVTRRGKIEAAIEAEHHRFAEAIVRERPDVVLQPGHMETDWPQTLEAIWHHPVDGLAPADLYTLETIVGGARIFVPTAPELAHTSQEK